MSDSALVPVQQKQVIFNDDEITAVLVRVDSAEEIYVSIRQLCERLGVSYQGQMRRINDDPVLSRKVQGVNITFTPSGGRGGGAQTTNCLPVDYLNGWLFGINANRVRPEVRDRLILYQEKVYKVLAAAYREGQLSTDVDFEALLAQDSPEAQAYKMAQAVMNLARNQLLLRDQVEHHEQRLEAIEAQLGDTARNVTPDQASQISQAVKTVALALGKKTGRNEFGAVYGELYRKFGITSYKALPAMRFDEALRYLTDWHESVIGETPF